MNDKQKAKEILEYCLEYLGIPEHTEIHEFQETKLYKDMLREIEFMLTTD